MHLRSLTLKGFKSFPDRTRLEFGPGVSVIVGPNGSGKSNIAEAVLWALGEQSPTAVRGQTMQDVIFTGGHGVASRTATEVEVLLDNTGGALRTGAGEGERVPGPGGAGGPGGFAEISIVRHLDRSGEGGYRLNGARCRLVDVAEVLSDTGLGREMHSVVSQGRVDAIVHSRPRERRLLIEEAAGLGKHRRRRRRAEMKLGHTRDNLARALDVEREARSGLRPLKRQAEAAELHERLERQTLEAQLELVRDELHEAEAEREEAELAARAARAHRDELDRRLTEIAERRELAEAEFGAHARAREELRERVHAARSAAERIALRAERARDTARAAAEGAERRRAELERLEREADAEGAAGAAGDDVAERVRSLEAELAGLEERVRQRREEELERLERELETAEGARRSAEAEVSGRAARLEELEREAEGARTKRRETERAVESARAQAAAAGAELAAVDASLRALAGTAGGAAEVLAHGLEVEPGYDVALAAALGPRLRASVVDDLAAAEAVLARGGRGGASALVAKLPASEDARGREPEAAASPPAPAAERLRDRVRSRAERAEVLDRLLDGVWVVESLSAVRSDFSGVAVTRDGRVLDTVVGELRRPGAGGEQRLLEERNRRDELIAVAEAAAVAETEARAEGERARERVAAADRERESADAERREAVHAFDAAAEAGRRISDSLRRRREAPDVGPESERRTALEAELRAERLLAERLERERADRAVRREGLRAGIARDRALADAGEWAAAALAAAEAAVSERRDALTAELEAAAALGERTAAELRPFAREEAELQGGLRAAAEAVTGAEVNAARARDRARERAGELSEVRRRLGRPEREGAEGVARPPEPRSTERRVELERRVERLRRRREQLGPVNPLAAEAYAEALAHVEELEAQRTDLEAALADLESLMADIDRTIRQSFEETFAAAARNFEDVAEHLFPGGRGRLRLVRPDGGGPKGAVDDEVDRGAEPENGAEPGGEGEREPREEPGVEVEVTPAGKATRRLSLLSGGEKSLVALAFLFAVFLARPCPFYILDEVEAALDDLNVDRFLELLRRYSDRAQFIVVTHQKRTMDAADRVYGVSMGRDGVSKVVSRRLRGHPGAEADAEIAGGPGVESAAEEGGAGAAAPGVVPASRRAA